MPSARMSPFDAWSTYMAIKLHFDKGTFDAFKFNFKGPRLSQSAFNARKDRYFFEKVAKKYSTKSDMITFFLANYLEGNSWVGTMNDSAPMNWISRMQRLDYAFSEDMSVLKTHCDKCLCTFDDALSVSPDRSVPLIIELYQSQKISLESVVVLDVLLNFIPRINKVVTDPLGMFEEMFHKMIRYKPFIGSRVNTEKSKLIVIKSFT
jgi:hypothetical protein